jgi:hypothetical protein
MPISSCACCEYAIHTQDRAISIVTNKSSNGLVLLSVLSIIALPNNDGVYFGCFIFDQDFQADFSFIKAFLTIRGIDYTITYSC